MRKSMRNRVFRAKDIKTGEWIEGAYFEHDTVKVCFAEDDPETKFFIVSDGFCDWGLEPPITINSVDPETVGEYTGLKDKNGKRIFEGDILKSATFWLQMPINAVVGFKDGSFGFTWLRGEAYMFSPFPTVCNIEYEVIGNVHDNPELLRGSEE